MVITDEFTWASAFGDPLTTQISSVAVIPTNISHIVRSASVREDYDHLEL